MNTPGENLPDWLVVPLIPGTKVAKGKWNARLYAEHPEQTVVMRLSELMRRKREFQPFDIGVLLDLNGLVLVDADVSSTTDIVQDGNTSRYVTTTIDGRANLREWESAIRATRIARIADSPDTWHDISPGDPGRHDRGEHYLYKQNPDAPMAGHWWIAPNVEVKTSGIMRIGLHGGQVSTLVHGGDPVMIPAELARAMMAGRIKRDSSSSGVPGIGEGQEPKLFELAGNLTWNGASEDEAREAYYELARSFTALDPSWPWDEEAIADRFAWHWEYHQGGGGIAPAPTEVQTRWLASLAESARRKAELDACPIKTHDRSIRNISALSGDERLKRFDEVERLESDRHYLATDWLHDRELQGKYLRLMPRLRLGVVKVDDPWVIRTFTAEELTRLSQQHKRIARIDDEIIALDIIQPKETEWRSGDGGDHSITDRGQRWLAVLTALYLAEIRGDGLSSPQVSKIVSFNKELCGLATGHHRDISPSRVRQIRGELLDAGLITRDIEGHAYLARHARAYCPEVNVLSVEARSMVLDHLERVFNTEQTDEYSGVKNLAEQVEALADRLLKPLVRASHRQYWRRVRMGRQLSRASTRARVST